MAQRDLLARMISGNVSKLGTQSGPDLREIPLEDIHDNPKNFFPVTSDSVAQLAESIQVSGIQQPPVVTPDENGGYRLVAGHRRTAAVRLLHEKDPEDRRWETIRCQVSKYSSPEAEELALIVTNTEVRKQSWSWTNQAAERTMELLSILQEQQGVKLPGRMRTQVAQHLQISTAKLGRAQYIAKHLIPELQQKFPDLSEFPAHELAHLTREQQLQVAKRYRKKQPPTAAEVKAWRSSWEKNENPFDKMDQQRAEDKRRKEEEGPKIHCPKAHGGWELKKNCDKGPCGQECCYLCPTRYYCDTVCGKVVEQMMRDPLQKTLALRIHAVLERGGVATAGVKELEHGTGRYVSGMDAVIQFARVNRVSLDFLFGLTEQGGEQLENLR